jgi:hypothetical protein
VRRRIAQYGAYATNSQERFCGIGGFIVFYRAELFAARANFCCVNALKFVDFCAKLPRSILCNTLIQESKKFLFTFLFTPFYFFQGGSIMTENSLVYATIVFGVVGAMLTVVLVAVVKALKHEGTRPEDDHL